MCIFEEKITDGFMIRKIRNDEYLKRYNNMTAWEKSAYESRVGEWMANKRTILLPKAEEDVAHFQSALQCGVVWNDDECLAFEDGARLLTALIGQQDTWLPDKLFDKSARRAIRRMDELLSAIGGGAAEQRGAAALYNHEPKSAAGAGAEHPQALPAPGAGRSPAQAPQAATMKSGDTPMPVRPRHIDQYVHLLPQQTQERAAQIKGLLRDLDETREKARLLMDAGDHSDKIAFWARQATKLDGAVKSIYRELDREWDKLVEQGRVGVDDFGNAYLVKNEELRVKSEESAAAQEPSDMNCSEPTELTSEQKHRRRELRKFLVDTRRGNGKTREEHVKKWLEAWEEYITLEPEEAAMNDAKIAMAMIHYGIGRVKS